MHRNIVGSPSLWLWAISPQKSSAVVRPSSKASKAKKSLELTYSCEIAIYRSPISMTF